MLFTDIHSHFIYNVDDGAQNMDQTLAMLEAAQRRNIRHLLATPHISDETNEAVSQRILEHFQEIEQKVKSAGLDIKISLGSEIFYGSHINNHFSYPWSTFADNGKYFLFELPLFDLPDGVSDFIFNSKIKGRTPILAHPERYLYLRNALPTLMGWYRQGCLMQMNAGSITGHFGQRVADFSGKLLMMGFYHFVASDAHDTNFRNYKALEEAYEEATTLLDKQELETLFYLNPERAIKGEPIAQREIDEDIFKESWLHRLFSPIKQVKMRLAGQ